uniref:Chromo domain-containing protein n=1 Tax=Peronospora matthiolae TaxID=2874970 RepID=A0AAV1VKZ8_9STRA
MDADVDAIDIDDDDHDDANIFSIANDRQSEDDDTLTGEDNVLSAVHTKRTAVDKDELAEEYLLTREAVVRFVQDSFADAIDKLKRIADKHGIASVLSFDEGDLVLLSTGSLPKHAVTNVCSSKLLSKYIGPFLVLRRMGKANTIELPLSMRTHTTFYVERLRPYYQHEPASRGEEHLRSQGPKSPSSGPVSTSQSGRLAKRPAHAVERCTDELQSDCQKDNQPKVCYQVARTIMRHHRSNDRALANCNYPFQGHGSLNAESVHEPGYRVTVPLHVSVPKHRADPNIEPDQAFQPPPHPLVDSGGGQRFLVERLLNHRDVNGVRTSYLVLWRGYPPAWDSWEPRAQLIVDVPGLVEKYDETHPLRLKKGRQKTTCLNASTGIARCQSLRPSRKGCALSSRDH